ncbi:hypothetical protein TTHERM_00931930 (macronuclear) [Tetrahymena thermophila SB210]|uniref:Uncharacterized protein n=1 Tax=Tetrahymena thermophila (strain SB210) TaxID=312017 RepID=I7MGK2_TETTS|nr:hypothetical protein TTHERM_00931930 [Tetrahymena thermophila SB210]EAS01603.2 hypothetical protein TTHERM_00931930 [Tetrahymena thermophila SB210]|eukprot:XP_001021848.2 hypothetical protein TTHERM_00931930 [Tetrahymena thermophila SB210]
MNSESDNLQKDHIYLQGSQKKQKDSFFDQDKVDEVLTKSEQNSNKNIQSIKDIMQRHNKSGQKKQNLDAQQYLIDFKKYLQKKQTEKKRIQNNDLEEFIQSKEQEESQKNKQKLPNRQDIIQKELNKRLKLISKSKEAKFNDIVGVFKKLETFIDIKPFLHDLNTVNNTKIYNTIQELKQRIAEKRNQEEVEVMLEQVKEKIQKQEQEQEEENKILNRGMKQFEQKTQLLKETFDYVMDWKKSHDVTKGILSEQLIDHYRLQDNFYQDLINKNDPDIDTYQFYDDLNKQLFKKKTLFQKFNASQIDSRKSSINQNAQLSNQDEIQILDDQIVGSNKKIRLKNQEEDITEEEKLRLAQQSIKTKLLTIDGFEKDNQKFSDQNYFNNFQEKAIQIRKNLQKATEIVFKKKWANANVKLKKMREDDYNKVMKQIKEAQKSTKHIQSLSKSNLFSKQVESQVAKIFKNTQNTQNSQNSQDQHYQNELKSKRSMFLNKEIASYKGQQQQISRNNSYYSKDSQNAQQQLQKSPQLGSEYSQQEDDLDQVNLSRTIEDIDEEFEEDDIYSKKWKQIQNDKRLSQSINHNVSSAKLDRLSSFNNSKETTPQKIIQKNFTFITNITNKNFNETVSQQNKSQFVTQINPSSQSLLFNSQTNPSVSRRKSVNLQTNNKQGRESNINELQNQYFFPSSTRTLSNQISQFKNQHQFQFQTSPSQSNSYVQTSRRNTFQQFSKLKNSSSAQLLQKNTNQTSTLQTLTSRSSIHPFKKQILSIPSISKHQGQNSSHHKNQDSKNSLKINIVDQIQGQKEQQYLKLDSYSIQNPPSSPSQKHITYDRSYSRDQQRKQVENQNALDKHLFGVKFQKFLSDIDNHQLKFGITKERYQSKINQIQKKFDNEITKFEPPKLDIFKSIQLYKFYYFLLNKIYQLGQKNKINKQNIDMTKET